MRVCVRARIRVPTGSVLCSPTYFTRGRGASRIAVPARTRYARESHKYDLFARDPYRAIIVVMFSRLLSGFRGEKKRSEAAFCLFIIIFFPPSFFFTTTAPRVTRRPTR